MRYFVLFLLFISAVWGKIVSDELIIVTTPNWNANSGELRFFVKDSRAKWQEKFKSPVFVGRNGLAWGIGLHKRRNGIAKKEGDGRAPAGIFKLDYAFGYQKENVSYPYRVMNRFNRCVDDIKSKNYNKIIDSRKVPNDYNSSESMVLKKNYYKLGIVVNHNGFTGTPIKGEGSCIFIHIKTKPTAGCTALPNEKSILKLLKLLKQDANPLLIQAPRNEINNLLKEIKNAPKIP